MSDDPRKVELRKKVVKFQVPLGVALFLLGIGLSILGIIGEGVRFSLGSLVFMFSAIPTWPFGEWGLFDSIGSITAYNFEILVFSWIVSGYGVYMMVTAVI